MRVMFVANSARFFVSHKWPIAAEWLRRGADVHVVAPADTVIPGVTQHALEMTRSGMSFDELRTIRDLGKIVRHIRPELIHTFSLKPALYATIAAGGVPIFNAITGLGHSFISNSPKMRIARSALKLGFRRFGREATYIFQTTHDRDTFAKFVPANRCHIVPGSGVDTEVFKPSPAPARPVVLYAGRMLATKGVREFMQAAKMVDAEFWLAGTPDPGNPASLSEEEIRLSPCRWLGYNDDMPALMSQCSIVCLPSYSEGVPKVLIEAAASGRPIIASDIPGCRDVCLHGVNGLLVPPRDPAAIARAVTHLLTDGRWNEFASASRQLALDRFDVRRIVRETFAIYGKQLDA